MNQKQKQERVTAIFNKRASKYDFWRRYTFLGGRKEAIKKLHLNKGDTVLNLACGTGLNFSELEQAVGLEGKIIGLDISQGMLKQAQKKINKYNWENIRLIQADATNFSLSEKVDGILCTHGLNVIPNWKQALICSLKYLKEGGYFVSLDILYSNQKLMGKIINPVAYRISNKQTKGMMELSRKPWEFMKKHLKEVKTERQGLFKTRCLSWGKK